MNPDQKIDVSTIIRKFKRPYITLFIFSASINILMLAPSWYMLQVYDRVLTSHDENTLLGLSLIVVFLYIIYALLERYRGLILTGVSEALDQNLAPLLHKAILSSSLKERQKELNSLNDLNTVKQFLTGQPTLSFLDAPWVFVYMATIFLLHSFLGLISIISAVLLLFLAIVNHTMIEGNLERAQKANISERKLVADVLSASDSIQTMGMRSAFSNKLAIIRSNYLENHLIASIRGVNLSSISKFFRTLIQSFALGYGAYLAINQEITGGMIIAGSILLGRTLAPIEGIIQSWKQLSEFKKSYTNLNQILRTVPRTNHSVDLGRPLGELQLVDVTVRLREHGKPTLDKINVRIAKGETLAIIGPSGAGKTSLLKTLCGIYKPQNGQVLIDGSDLAFRELESLGMYIGYLAQTTELLNGKASENIARFSNIDNEAVLKAAKLTGAHEMLISLPEGYETLLGDAGLGISEGQKRKVGLARALYGDPAIVFMDEPGAGLDDASLASVIKAIKTLKEQGVTVIYTTHQPSLMQLASNILVLVDGQIRGYGPSAEILTRLSVKANLG